MIKKSLDKEHTMDPQDSAPQSKKTLTLTYDYRWVIGALVAIIIVMFALWRPWEFQPDANTRTVKVTGEAKVTAVPDEFVFYPRYEFKNTDKDAALKALTAKSDEIVKKLKELGVPDNKIKTNSDGSSFPTYYNDENSSSLDPSSRPTGTSTYSLTLTITVGDKTLAQKVQDYLVTTTPTGAVSPQPTFSDAKRKELESKARDEATKEARAKAEQSAKNLGFRIVAIKSVDDGNGFDDFYPMLESGIGTDIAQPSKLSVQPGENDLTYSVTVVYYLR